MHSRRKITSFFYLRVIISTFTIYFSIQIYNIKIQYYRLSPLSYTTKWNLSYNLLTINVKFSTFVGNFHVFLGHKCISQDNFWLFSVRSQIYNQIHDLIMINDTYANYMNKKVCLITCIFGVEIIVTKYLTSRVRIFITFHYYYYYSLKVQGFNILQYILRQSILICSKELENNLTSNVT